MGTIAASFIILALIIYALKDLFGDKDLSSWTNMAITALILFTVILSIFMVLNKKEDGISDKKPKTTEETSSTPQLNKSATPEASEMTDDEAMMAIAKEYISIKDDCSKNPPQPKADCDEVASKYITGKYNFTKDEWESFLQTAQQENLFDKARGIAPAASAAAATTPKEENSAAAASAENAGANSETDAEAQAASDEEAQPAEEEGTSSGEQNRDVNMDLTQPL